MTTTTTSSLGITTSSYQISLNPDCIHCAPSLKVYQMIHDAPADNTNARWETFNGDSLPAYFKDGIRALRAHLDKLEDFSKPRKAEEDKNLWFMVESLIQARHLLDEMNEAPNARTHFPHQS